MDLQRFILPFIITIIVSYLLGSINFSIIITRHFEHEDIRNLGSGNAGFTNVLRSAGIMPSILTFILDFLKCALAVYLAHVIFYLASGNSITDFLALQANMYLAGFFCIAGHIYPCFFNFKGGKGVTSAAALALFTDWRVFVICISIFLIMLYFSRIVSLSSIIAVSSLFIVSFLVKFFLDYLPKQNPSFDLNYVFLSVVFYLLTAALVIFKHKDNISRLRSGQEKTIKAKSKS